MTMFHPSEDEMTPGAMRAWQAAAAAAHPRTVDSRALARCLLEETDGTAYKLATDRGLDVDRWLAEPENGLESAPASAVLNVARRYAREHFADRIITSELLVLALVETDPQLAADWERLGFSRLGLEEKALGESIQPVPLVQPCLPSETQRPTSIGNSHAYRILDANLNRAREAVRVIEDYCRFLRNDAALSRELKQIRHDLGKAATLLPAAALLANRDVQADVGTTISTTDELTRSSPEHVVAANSKRLQEALRSLEEFGKLVSPEFAIVCERLRYRAYKIEPAVVHPSSRPSLENRRLYMLIGNRPDMSEVIENALAGGVDMVQLRLKNVSDRDFLASAERVRKIVDRFSALLIINDRPDIAAIAGADGVHLGQDDLPISEARQVVGSGRLIGISTHSPDQLRRAISSGADYVGVGPTFPSSTKSFDCFPGLDFVRESSALSPIPTFAIGGITIGNLPEVLSSGARRVAVGAAVAEADNPRAAAERFRAMLESSN